MSVLTVENFRLTAALTYAAMGWCVFPVHTPKFSTAGARCSCGEHPCKSLGKHPRTFRGLLDATADTEAIREWWGKWPDANIGLQAGTASGFVVLDIDAKENGGESLALLLVENPELPQTVEAVSGSSPPGAHYYFSHPGHPVKSSTGKIARGIDVRGDGGYIVAPPSLHKSESRYAWVREQSPEDIALAPVPGWLLAKMTEPELKPVPRPSFNGRPIPDDAANHWLGKALAKAVEGARNGTGLWLAAQLRDNGVTEASAEATMREYAMRVPQGAEKYREGEALSTLRQAYRRPPRDPAKGVSFAQKVIKANPPPKKTGAAAELSEHYEDIIARRIYSVPWPWDYLSRLTQALIPGTITVVCGDPSVGKTFFVLQALRFWHGNGFEPVVFFAEKDRKFYTKRLMAQLEHDGRFIDWDLIPENGETVREALVRHQQTIDEIGKCIYTATDRATLDSILAWIRQRASAGKRVLVVDPITAISAGADRWTKDDDFVIAAQSVATAHGCSIVLITHPKKGNRPGAPSGHDMAAGAAYYRFADTTIWIVKPKQPKRVRYMTKCGPSQGEIPIFFQLHKTRDGKGGGMELAYLFRELEYTEQGIVLGEAKEE